MTRIEKGLWGTVVILLGCVIVLSCIILSRSPVHESPKDASNPTEEEAPGDSNAVATIGDDTITAAELQTELARRYGAEALRQLLTSKVIAKEAATLGIDVTDEEVDQEMERIIAGYDDEATYYESMKKQLGLSPEQIRKDTMERLLTEKLAISSIDVSPKEIDAYLQEHADEFEPRVQLEISQIVVDKEQDAKSILEQLEAGSSFGELAHQFSTDEFSATSGGSIGFVDADDPFVSSGILRAAAKLEIGQIDGPIALQSGYALIQLTGRREKKSMDRAAARLFAQKEVALSKGQSIQDLQEELLRRYNAKILDSQFQTP